MTDFSIDDLPRDILFSMALQMDGPTLRKFCRSHKRANTICTNPYFQDAWIRYHDQLTFDQRDKIDNIIDQITEKIIEEAEINLSNEDINRIKKIIKEKYRTIIGRDLRPFILKNFPKYFEYLQSDRESFFLASFISFLKSRLRYLGLDDIFLDEIPIPWDTNEHNRFGQRGYYSNLIRMGLDWIFDIFGFNIKDSDRNNPDVVFKNLVRVYPELSKYRNLWYELFSTIPVVQFI